MKLESFLLQLLIWFFGCLIAYRMLGRAESTALIPSESRFKILIVIYLVNFIVVLLFQIKVFLFFCVFLFLLPSAMMSVVELLRRAQFENAAIEILDLSVLRMKAGTSFRQATSESIEALPYHLRFYFMELMSHLTIKNLDQNSSRTPMEREFLRILIAVDESSTRQIERLSSYRANEKMKNHFRLKSRQMTLQARLQAAILLVLYVSLAAFQLVHHAKIIYEPYFWISTGALAVGSILLFLIPRTFRWKV